MDFVLKVPKSTASTQVYLLGYSSQPLSSTMGSDGLHIKFPVVPLGNLSHAWVFKLVNII